MGSAGVSSLTPSGGEDVAARALKPYLIVSPTQEAAQRKIAALDQLADGFEFGCAQRRGAEQRPLLGRSEWGARRRIVASRPGVRAGHLRYV